MYIYLYYFYTHIFVCEYGIYYVFHLFIKFNCIFSQSIPFKWLWFVWYCMIYILYIYIYIYIIIIIDDNGVYFLLFLFFGKGI